MKNKFITLLIIFFVIIACKPVIKTVYGINRNIEFIDRPSYIEFLKKKHHFDFKNMYYANDETYNNFIYTIADSKIDYFYGVFINDSVKINKSKFLSENQSCRGRIMGEIENANSNLREEDFTIDYLLLKNKFYNIIDDQPLKLDFNKKKIIFLIFSYKMGSLRKKDFEEIEKLFNNKKDYVLYILNIDRIEDLK